MVLDHALCLGGRHVEIIIVGARHRPRHAVQVRAALHLLGVGGRLGPCAVTARERVPDAVREQRLVPLPDMFLLMLVQPLVVAVCLFDPHHRPISATGPPLSVVLDVEQQIGQDGVDGAQFHGFVSVMRSRPRFLRTLTRW